MRVRIELEVDEHEYSVEAVADGSISAYDLIEKARVALQNIYSDSQNCRKDFE